jgi:hypothetical protein
LCANGNNNTKGNKVAFMIQFFFSSSTRMSELNSQLFQGKKNQAYNSEKNLHNHPPMSEKEDRKNWIKKNISRIEIEIMSVVSG